MGHVRIYALLVDIKGYHYQYHNNDITTTKRGTLLVNNDITYIYILKFQKRDFLIDNDNSHLVFHKYKAIGKTSHFHIHKLLLTLANAMQFKIL